MSLSVQSQNIAPIVSRATLERSPRPKNWVCVAVENNQYQELLSRKISVAALNYEDLSSLDRLTPLQTAIVSGYRKAANVLLNMGADVNYALIPSRLPLHLAQKARDYKMMSRLLKMGATVTPLMLLKAIMDHDKRALNLLLSYHPEAVNHCDEQEKSVLHYLLKAECSKEQLQEAVSFLLDNGANPLIQDKKGVTPLHLACGLHAFEVVEQFLCKVDHLSETGKIPQGKDPYYLRDESGHSPLDWALWEGNPEAAFKRQDQELREWLAPVMATLMRIAGPYFLRLYVGYETLQMPAFLRRH